MKTHDPRGITLVESLLAVTILSIVVLATTAASIAGHQHLRFGGETLLAVRLAEDLLEEMLARPYGQSHAPARADWFLDDFHDFAEAAGSLRDFLSDPYDDRTQRFSRSVTVTATTIALPAPSVDTVPGRLVQIVVGHPSGATSSLRRFVAEPAGGAP